MTTWEPVATVVRSQCHDRTWIGHGIDSTFNDTPAGPLHSVKDAVEDLVTQGWDQTTEVRWRRQNDADTWICEVR